MSLLYCCNYKDQENIKNLIEQIKNILTLDTIIINIGTDASIGDSVAPLVGTMLTERNCKIPIYGTLENPIHAMNLDNEIKKIKKKHLCSNIIAIDAAAGDKEEIGMIKLHNEPIHPGSGVKKKIQPVGDYSIKIINMEYACIEYDLFNARLRYTYKIAKVLTDVLTKAINTYNQENNNVEEVII